MKHYCSFSCMAADNHKAFRNLSFLSALGLILSVLCSIHALMNYSWEMFPKSDFHELRNSCHVAAGYLHLVEGPQIAEQSCPHD